MATLSIEAEQCHFSLGGVTMKVITNDTTLCSCEAPTDDVTDTHRTLKTEQDKIRPFLRLVTLLHQ